MPTSQEPDGSIPMSRSSTANSECHDQPDSNAPCREVASTNNTSGSVKKETQTQTLAQTMTSCLESNNSHGSAAEPAGIDDNRIEKERQRERRELSGNRPKTKEENWDFMKHFVDHR